MCSRFEKTIHRSFHFVGYSGLLIWTEKRKDGGRGRKKKRGIYGECLRSRPRRLILFGRGRKHKNPMRSLDCVCVDDRWVVGLGA